MFSLDFVQLMEVGTGRLRIEQTRTPDFVFWLGQEPQPRQVFGLDGDVGFDLAPNGEASRVPNAESGDRRAAFYHHPIIIIRAALDAVATVTNDLSDDHTIHVITADGVELTCEPGRRQRPPQPVEATRDDANADPTAPPTAWHMICGRLDSSWTDAEQPAERRATCVKSGRCIHYARFKVPSRETTRQRERQIELSAMPRPTTTRAPARSFGRSARPERFA